MTPQQQFRRMLWEDYYNKLEYHPIDAFELGMSEVHRVAAKFNCPQLSLENSSNLPLKVAYAIYEKAKDRPSIYKKLNLDIYPDHDGTSTIVTLSYDLPRSSISVDVKGDGSGKFTLFVKRRQHQTASADKYMASVALRRLDNVELENVAPSVLDAIANELRG